MNKKHPKNIFDLDIVIPTYNRPELLKVTLQSICSALKPKDFSFRVVVVDNNSSAINSKKYIEIIKEFNSRYLIYLNERQQGRSSALNTGVNFSEADYIGFIDDDEEIDSEWLVIANEYIKSASVDYIVGPYKPKWESPPPEWLPVFVGKYKGVLGWIEQHKRIISFDDFDGTLVGGNAIVRRSVLIRLGGFSTLLGRSGKNLMGGEDEEFHRRLKSISALGYYDPRLSVMHLIPTNRMTRSYHLRWAFWSGVSNGSRLIWEGEKHRRTFFGIPRYRYRMFLSGIFSYATSLLTSNSSRKPIGFSGIMDSLYLVGMIYGKFFFKK